MDEPAVHIFPEADVDNGHVIPIPFHTMHANLVLVLKRAETFPNLLHL